MILCHAQITVVASTVHGPHGVHPLGKLKVVLVLAFDELGDFDVLGMSGFVERRLQQLEVSDIVVFRNRFPLDLVHRKYSRVHRVEELAVNCASSQLFDLRDSQLRLSGLHLESIVDPLQHIVLRYRVREIHHSDGVSHSCRSRIIIDSKLRRNYEPRVHTGVGYSHIHVCLSNQLHGECAVDSIT